MGCYERLAGLDQMPRLSPRDHERRDQACLKVKEAVRAKQQAEASLDDAIATAVDASVPWLVLSDLTGIHRATLSKKWTHRRH